MGVDLLRVERLGDGTAELAALRCILTPAGPQVPPGQVTRGAGIAPRPGSGMLTHVLAPRSRPWRHGPADPECSRAARGTHELSREAATRAVFRMLPVVQPDPRAARLERALRQKVRGE